ncbi:MAG: carboxypeptidase regulatory-like domain-containing protein [Holophagaceae bacterium]|nr:carboxypeptidase regulatory-like domain-containing protein [Holophagaceae bacterium]
MSNLSRPFLALLFASSLVAQLPTKEPAPKAPPRAKPERPAPQQDPDKTNGNVSAYVSTEDGKPFANAVVILELDGKEARVAATGENGYVTFIWVAPGTYKAIFRREGYAESVVEHVKVEGGANIEIKATLVKKK